ncbi:hypothetical protein [Streptococcus mutans]|nr:hypothetical protein [Streptococcus mutans]
MVTSWNLGSTKKISIERARLEEDAGKTSTLLLIIPMIPMWSSTVKVCL